MLLTCSAYNIIHKKYDDLFDGHDNLNVILKSPPRRVIVFVCIILTERVLTKSDNPHLRKEPHTRR